MLQLLRNLEFSPADVCQTLHRLADQVAFDTDGTGLEISFSDETGHLTNNLGIICFGENKLSMGVNLRYPVTQNQQHLE